MVTGFGVTDYHRGCSIAVRLQIRVPLVIMTILAVIGIVSSGIMLHFQRGNLEHEFDHMAMVLAGVLQASVEHGMLIDEREAIQEAIIRISEEEMVSRVILLSANGKIVASSNMSEIGKVSDREEVHQTLRSAKASVWTERQNGNGELSVITPVLNKPECQTCHSPAITVLGGIQVSLYTFLLDDQLKQQTIFFVVFGLIAILTMGIALTFALRRMVLKPISGLVRSAQRLSQSDYTTRIRSETNDEIGMLCQAFNEMAQSVEQRSRELEASRQELAKWNLDLEQKIQQRTGQLVAFNSIISTVSQSLDLGRMLDAVMDKILAVMDIDAGAIHLLGKETGRLHIMVHQGLSPGCTQKLATLELRGSIWGQIVQSGQPIVVDDKVDVLNTTGMEGEKGRFHAGTILAVKSENKVQGTLALASYLPGKFQPELVRLLQAMSDAIGIGVANAIATKSLKQANELREQLLEKLISAQEEERKRIARVLHDEAGQSLASLALQVEDIADNLPAKYHAARQRLGALKEQAVQILDGMRNLALELRPSVLDHLGLSKAIEWYAKDFLGKHGLDAKVDITGPRINLPLYTETMLFRIAQEALTNVVKHAQASQVAVSLQLINSKVTMLIEDNGKGFDVDSALGGVTGQKSLGLHGMIERATLLGGTINIRSKLGKGTYLSIEIPLAGGASANEQD